MTGFEPATTRPPDEYSTGLSYIPMIKDAKIILLRYFFNGIFIIIFSLDDDTNYLCYDVKPEILLYAYFICCYNNT